MTTVIITDNIQKVLAILPKYTKGRTIGKQHVCTNDIVDIEFVDGIRIMIFTLIGLKNSNIQIKNLILDKDIPQDIINKEIMPKYISRKEDIKWI